MVEVDIFLGSFSRAGRLIPGAARTNSALLSAPTQHSQMGSELPRGIPLPVAL